MVLNSNLVEVPRDQPGASPELTHRVGILDWLEAQGRIIEEDLQMVEDPQDDRIEVYENFDAAFSEVDDDD